jgi:AcrR family transcriptional regulator
MGVETVSTMSLEPEVIDATLVAFARRGVGATSLDRVADLLGTSRATLYRLVPGGKDVLLGAVWGAERRRLLDAIDLALAPVDVDDLAGRIQAICIAAGSFVAHHPALAKVITGEPELVQRFVTFHAGEGFLAAATADIAPRLGTSPCVAELLVRQLLSHVLEPSPFVALGDPGSVARWASTFVIPGLMVVAARTAADISSVQTPPASAVTRPARTGPA